MTLYFLLRELGTVLYYFLRPDYKTLVWLQLKKNFKKKRPSPLCSCILSISALTQPPGFVPTAPVPPSNSPLYFLFLLGLYQLSATVLSPNLLKNIAWKRLGQDLKKNCCNSAVFQFPPNMPIAFTQPILVFSLPAFIP